MRALLDINILLALLDKAHVHHQRARSWFRNQVSNGWASCPFTQNGFVRIISQPRYPKAISTSQAITLLSNATSTSYHDFWPANVSLLDNRVLDSSRVHGPKQITDLYLLALSVSNGGCLATFDQNIPLSAVPGASAKNLVIV